MEFFPFFMIFLATILFSSLFKKFHLPWVFALIAAGVALGPYGLSVLTTNPTIEFIGQVGLIFLMFMAGLETKLSSFREFGSGIALLAIMNAAIPFAGGYAIGWFFGFPVIPSLLLGIIFMSSSIAVIVPTMEASGLSTTKLGRSIVSATVLEDVASLVFLSILLQSINPTTSLPLPSFYVLLTVLLISLRYGLPKIRSLFPQKRDEKDLFESEVRIIFALLIGTVVIFEILGLHPIIAGFFTGLVLSDTVTSKILIEKLRTISFGIFIPVFFVVIGMETDITVFTQGSNELFLIAAVVLGSIFTKFISGFLGGRFSGFTEKESLVVGISTIPQLSTTLAVVFTAVSIGILKDSLITAMVILSIVTTIAAPLALRFIIPEK